MLFKNLYIENATEAMDIRVTDGKFEKIAASLEALPGEEVIDCGGKLALPPVIESHVHLDTCPYHQPCLKCSSATIYEESENAS